MRKLITLGLLFSLLTLALATAPTTSRTFAQANTELQYAAKFVCGRANGAPASPGDYYTMVNVRNPSPNRAVKFRKKFARALPDEKAGKVTQFFKAELQADEALGIDCLNIYQHTGITPGTFIEGYVVINTPTELDVATVYTAGHPQVETLHTERVQPRRVPIPPPCANLNLSLSTGTANWQIISDPDASTVEPRAASDVIPPNVGWSSVPSTRWIGPKTISGTDVNGLEGDYTYQVCFCLCNEFSDARLTVIGLADNSAKVLLNNTQISPAIPGFTAPAMFLQTTDQQLFNVGQNCVQVVVHNDGGPTGFDLSGVVVATAGRCQ